MIPKIKLTPNLVSLVLMLLFAALAVIAYRAYEDMKADRDRLRNNQWLLLHNGEVEITETGTGRSRASAPPLTLRPGELRQSGDTLAKVARQAGIKPGRIGEAATAATITHVDITAPLSAPDTSKVKNAGQKAEAPDSALCFSWQDPWVTLNGCIADSTFSGSLTATDTLDIIVHRIPKRFLFFRFGCKEVRMDIISRNPHTRLTYARYYKLVK